MQTARSRGIPWRTRGGARVCHKAKHVGFWIRTINEVSHESASAGFGISEPLCSGPDRWRPGTWYLQPLLRNKGA